MKFTSQQQPTPPNKKEERKRHTEKRPMPLLSPAPPVTIMRTKAAISTAPPNVDFIRVPDQLFIDLIFPTVYCAFCEKGFKERVR